MTWRVNRALTPCVPYRHDVDLDSAEHTVVGPFDRRKQGVGCRRSILARLGLGLEPQTSSSRLRLRPVWLVSSIASIPPSGPDARVRRDRPAGAHAPPAARRGPP